MKSRFFGYITGFSLLIVVILGAYYVYANYGNEDPTPEHEISISGTLQSVATVRGKYKETDYVIGYRMIIADSSTGEEYVIISTTGGLIGNSSKITGSPGMVPKAITESFAEVVNSTQETLRDHLPVCIYGDLMYERKKSQISFSIPFFKKKEKESEDDNFLLFEDKKVILLYGISLYGGKELHIDRNPKRNS